MTPVNGGPLSFQGWALVYGVAGFIALGLEITWFRLLGVVLKSTAFTFGTLLGVYLTGLGLGATLASRRVTRSRSPGTTFLLLQCGAALYAGLSTAILMAFIAAGHPIKLVQVSRWIRTGRCASDRRSFARCCRSPMPERSLPSHDFVVLYLVLPGLIIGPPTLLMGMSFPYLQKASHADLPRLGRRLGILLATNIAGSALGATLTGWLFLPRLGTASTLKLLVGLGVFLALPLARETPRRRPRATMAAMLSGALVTASVIVAMPDSNTLWARLHTRRPIKF